MELEKNFTRLFRANTIAELRLLGENKCTPLNTHSVMYLDLIYYNEGITVSAIAQMLNVAKPAATQKVNELEKKGLVEKVQSEQDKRVFYIKITKKAEEEYNFIFKPYVEAFSKISQKYSIEEQQICANIIAEICDSLETIN